MNPKTFTASTSWFDAMSGFPQGLRCEIYDAIFYYVETGEMLKISPIAKAVFAFIRNEIDADNKRKNIIREKRRASGRKGGIAKTQKIHQNE